MLREEKFREISRPDLKEFKNGETLEKEYYLPKQEYVSTPAIEAAASRALKNLVAKGYLERRRDWGPRYLTEKGFLKVKNCHAVSGFVNFNEYQEAVNEREKERASFFSKPTLSEEAKAKHAEYDALHKEYAEKFTIENIYALCCEKCQEKINRYQIECGINKLNELAKELQDIS